MKLHTLFIILTSVLVLSACHDDPVDEVSTTPQKTIIVYMAAENSLYGFVQDDLNEMRIGAAELPLEHQIIVFLDNRQNPRIYRINRNGMETVKEYTEDFYSTDSTMMENVLKDIFTTYPAQSYGMVLWSHGSGWVPAVGTERAVQPRSFGIDNGQNTSSNSGQEMEIHTLAHILSHHPHLEFILFDACLMQSIEVAYELKDVTDYIIGSPAETPGTGAPYHKILPAMFSHPADISSIVNEYFSYYENSYGMLISAIRTSKLEALANLVHQHLSPLCNNRTSLSTEDIQAYYAFHKNTGYKPEYFDMNDIMKHHLPEQAYSAWLPALDEAVPYRRATSRWLTSFSSVNPYIKDLSVYGGITMYIPNEKYTYLNLNTALHAYKWYKAAGWDTTGW